MWWIYERTKEMTEHLKDHTKCKRCGQYFHNDFEACNLCSHLSDSELKISVETRKQFGMSLGKWMVLGAALVVLALIALSKT